MTSEHLGPTPPDSVDTVNKVIAEFETSPEELAQQASRPTDVTVNPPGDDPEALTRRGDEPATTADPVDPNETPPKAKRTRKTKPKEPPAAGGGTGSQPQIGLEDEFFQDGELVENLKGMITEVQDADKILSEDAAKRYKDATKKRKDMMADLRAAVPLDGKPHNYRVGQWIIEIPTLTEEKTSTRRPKQTARLKFKPTGV